jgi:glucose-6-phosphate isomerase
MCDILPMPQIPAWNALLAHINANKGINMNDLFEADSGRFFRFSASVPGMLLDYSKNKVTEKTMRLLFELAKDRHVEAKRDAMFAGDPINTTEMRAALHVALRGASDIDFFVDGINVSEDVSAQLNRLQIFTEAIHSGIHMGATGKQFTDVVAIGIGGSHLGPELVVQALKSPISDPMRVHFVSNVDGHNILQSLMELNAETTLVVIASKTFTTQDTMTNADTAKAWVCHVMGDDAVTSHFVALSANTEAVEKFGIKSERMFPMWDWVGGRYSLWSSIGLPIALAVGWDKFNKLLEGARQMDVHFQLSPMSDNLPILMALIGIWNINFLGSDCLAILPFDQRLKHLPAFLQQLDMESNGKGVLHSGRASENNTGPIVFGEVGTNGQHAFYQLLHQGQRVIPADFIAVATPGHGLNNHHDQVLASVLAQSRALMQGRTLEEADGNSHRVCPGNSPSNTLILEQLNAFNLGQLISLYEHKVFVQGVIWGINSFDQWGVELGKDIAGSLLGPIQNSAYPDKIDSSTAGLLQTLYEWRKLS